jgi:hypothetical protein
LPSSPPSSSTSSTSASSSAPPPPTEPASPAGQTHPYGNRPPPSLDWGPRVAAKCQHVPFSSHATRAALARMTLTCGVCRACVCVVSCRVLCVLGRCRVSL